MLGFGANGGGAGWAEGCLGDQKMLQYLCLKYRSNLSLKTIELIDPTPIPYNEQFTATEFEKIQEGLSPGSMDDKWIIKFSSPCLFFHRSWTGFGAFCVEFSETENGARAVKSFCAASMLEQDSHENQANILKFLIGNLLLSRALPFPNLGVESSSQADAMQHHMSGTGYPQAKAEKKNKFWRFW